MKQIKDLFSGHSGDYARFRPSYPEDLFKYLFNEVSSNELAWDAGTGNGQVALKLSAQFSQVIATDISQNQLRHAAKAENITYMQGRAEQCTLNDNSGDLVTVGQALHWFSIDEFFSEVRRVLKPKGLLACFGYELLTGPPSLDHLINQFYKQTLDGFWPAERDWIEKEYEDIGIPFTKSSSFETIVYWDYNDLAGYLSTWSAVKAYIRDHNEDPLKNYRQQLKTILPEKTKITFPVFLKTWRADL